MKKRSKRLFFALLLAGSVTLLATGCDKLKKEPETEAQTEPPTEKQTEPPTEKQTEPPTEKQTEPPTEKQTEPSTEAQTEPKVLTVDEEKAQETEFDQLRMLYAKDDINVRSLPGTDGDIFHSFMQGDTVTAVGETPNWYVVEIDGYDSKGYVSKQFVSDEKVEPKTDEERQQAIEQELGAAGSTDGSSTDGGSTDGGSTAGTAAPADTAAIDAEYGVGDFAESFSIQASTGANVRTTPSQDGEIIDTVASGTTVTALGETDRWYKIEYNGNVGYVNKNLFG